MSIQDVLAGRVAWKFGDDLDIDLIIGVENIKYYDPDHLRSVLMESYDSTFKDEVRPGDLLVGGRNFGYGHPHYPAMVAMRNAGIVAVVAESFAPGFWRGELYQGMPLVAVPGISDAVERWDEIFLDWQNATVKVKRTKQVLRGTPQSQHAIDVIKAGGGLNRLRAKYGIAGGAAPPAAAQLTTERTQG